MLHGGVNIWSQNNIYANIIHNYGFRYRQGNMHTTGHVYAHIGVSVSCIELEGYGPWQLSSHTPLPTSYCHPPASEKLDLLQRIDLRVCAWDCQQSIRRIRMALVRVPSTIMLQLSAQIKLKSLCEHQMGACEAWRHTRDPWGGAREHSVAPVLYRDRNLT
jgi:hypothetical protein